MKNLFGFINDENVNEKTVIEIARDLHCGIETKWFINGSQKKMLGIKLTCNGVYEEMKDFNAILKDNFNLKYKLVLTDDWKGLEKVAPLWK